MISAYCKIGLSDSLEIVNWMINSDLPPRTIKRPSNYHVTIVHRQEIDYPGHTFIPFDVTVTGVEALQSRTNPDIGVVVLTLESSELQAWFDEAVTAGMKHDFPTFLKHVTITNMVPMDVAMRISEKLASAPIKQLKIIQEIVRFY